MKDAIAAVRARIAKAESDRETWRASGMQEKYLEACSMVDALELQLEGLRTAVAPSAATEETLGEREGLMAQFSIAFNGRHYLYGPYRYDDLAHAVSYARLKPGLPPAPGQPAGERIETPTEAQHALMKTLSITHRDGVYHLGAYRYDRLAEAVHYARLELEAGIRRPPQ